MEQKNITIQSLVNEVAQMKAEREVVLREMEIKEKNIAEKSAAIRDLKNDREYASKNMLQSQHQILQMELDLKHSREKSAARAAALKTAKEEECALLKRHRELQNQIELARSAFFLLISDFEKDYPSDLLVKRDEENHTLLQELETKLRARTMAFAKQTDDFQEAKRMFENAKKESVHGKDELMFLNSQLNEVTKEVGKLQCELDNLQSARKVRQLSFEEQKLSLEENLGKLRVDLAVYKRWEAGVREKKKYSIQEVPWDSGEGWGAFSSRIGQSKNAKRAVGDQGRSKGDQEEVVEESEMLDEIEGEVSSPQGEDVQKQATEKRRSAHLSTAGVKRGRAGGVQTYRDIIKRRNQH